MNKDNKKRDHKCALERKRNTLNDQPFRRLTDYPIGVKILDIIEESHNTKTFILEKEMKAKPGQFVMVWVPRIDEKPFTVTQNGMRMAISVRKVGKATEAMHRMKKGDILGIRGPYGNGTFDLKNKKRIILVGGGCGTLPLALLLEEAVKNKTKVDAIIGADTKKNLLFTDRFRKSGAHVTITTDDGTEGTKGFVTVALEEKLKTIKYDAIYTCGPEIMMSFVLKLGLKYGVEVQASLEHWMKCGFGVCGQCALDPSGLCVCKDGPVFSTDVLKNIVGFGSTTRNKSGTIVEWKDMC
ncbi:MAG: dihydroorotate dehydrogenase electron transfer subunit [archaeon]